MATPPARTELADTYPAPSNAVFRTGIGKLHDFLMGLLGTTGNPAEARAALGIGAISNRNKVVNGRFLYNPRAVAGSVVLAAGAYGHATWKAGAAGCTYTFANSGNDVLVTITAGSLIHVIEGASIESGVYCMSWTGTAQGKIAGGSYGVSGVVSPSQTAGTNLQIEFGTGTVTRVQVEAGSAPTPAELRLPQQDIALCRRFVRAVLAGCQGAVTSGQPFGAYYAFDDQPMRAPPNATWIGSTFVGSMPSTTTTHDNISAFGFRHYKTATATTAAGGYIDSILLSAEL